jgi:glycolate oxidase FAD binding subunit
VVTGQLELDGLRPTAVERPESPEAAARLLATADEAGWAVVPVGGGRALGMGGAAERFDLALETSGLDRILDLSQADLTATVEAGVTLERLNEGLGRAGQFLPLDPMASPGHTIGGLLATGWSGPLRLGYGTAREFLIGLRVALPDGRLVRSGGRVVKNVSGYDMNKLHLGALGSLGLIVEASFKVFPRPRHEVWLAADAASPNDAWAMARQALALPQRPVALTLASGDGPLRLQARFGGSREGVERMAAELAWDRIDERPASATSGSWARISVPPAQLEGLVAGLPGRQWLALPGVGVVHWLDAADPTGIRQVRDAAEAVGGSLVLMAAATELKRAVGAWGTPPRTLELMRPLRDAFDPKRTMSPGRYLVQ